MLPAMAVDEETTASAREEPPALYTEKLPFRKTKTTRTTSNTRLLFTIRYSLFIIH